MELALQHRDRSCGYVMSDTEGAQGEGGGSPMGDGPLQRGIYTGGAWKDGGNVGWAMCGIPRPAAAQEMHSRWCEYVKESGAGPGSNLVNAPGLRHELSTQGLFSRLPLTRRLLPTTLARARIPYPHNAGRLAGVQP